MKLKVTKPTLIEWLILLACVSMLAAILCGSKPYKSRQPLIPSNAWEMSR